MKVEPTYGDWFVEGYIFPKSQYIFAKALAVSLAEENGKEVTIHQRLTIMREVETIIPKTSKKQTQPQTNQMDLFDNA